MVLSFLIPRLATHYAVFLCPVNCRHEGPARSDGPEGSRSQLTSHDMALNSVEAVSNQDTLALSDNEPAHSMQYPIPDLSFDGWDSRTSMAYSSVWSAFTGPF